MLLAPAFVEAPGDALCSAVVIALEMIKHSNEQRLIDITEAEELENEFTKEEMRVLRKLSTRGREFENAAKKALTEEIRASQKQLLAPGQTVADLVGGADGTPSRGVHSAEAAARERDSQRNQPGDDVGPVVQVTSAWVSFQNGTLLRSKRRSYRSKRSSKNI